jgi:hypothetical protein
MPPAASTASPLKPSKQKLAQIQPPTYYGCGMVWSESCACTQAGLEKQTANRLSTTEHIGMMFQKDENRKTTKNFYSSATRVALDLDRLTAQKCEKCKYILTRTYLCVQCSTVHCPKDAQKHFKEERHTFGGT